MCYNLLLLRMVTHLPFYRIVVYLVAVNYEEENIDKRTLWLENYLNTALANPRSKGLYSHIPIQTVSEISLGNHDKTEKPDLIFSKYLDTLPEPKLNTITNAIVYGMLHGILDDEYRDGDSSTFSGISEKENDPPPSGHGVESDASSTRNALKRTFEMDKLSDTKIIRKSLGEQLDRFSEG